MLSLLFRIITRGFFSHELNKRMQLFGQTGAEFFLLKNLLQCVDNTEEVEFHKNSNLQLEDPIVQILFCKPTTSNQILQSELLSLCGRAAEMPKGTANLKLFGPTVQRTKTWLDHLLQ